MTTNISQFEVADISRPLSGAERQARYRATHGSANEIRTRYRRRNSKWETDASYLSRPIVAYDGEGITVDGTHLYTSLAAMNNVDGRYEATHDARGLSTAECLEFLLANAIPKAIHVVYGGSYDVNMMLRDFKRWQVARVYRNPSFTWNGYRLAWRTGKSLTDTHVETKRSMILYDVMPFFQCPFVKACDDYLGDRFVERDAIVAGKAMRGSFTASDNVDDYNKAELQNLLLLVAELRERLNKVGLRPKRWDGPGAIAAALLQRENVKDALAETPPAIARASRYAYAGGRFETIKFGVWT